jgi:hypothetical protein
LCDSNLCAMFANCSGPVVQYSMMSSMCESSRYDSISSSAEHLFGLAGGLQFGGAGGVAVSTSGGRGTVVVAAV